MNNNHIPEGCILLARKLQTSDIWKKPADWLKIWIYILQEVNHGDKKPFPRGSNFFNFQDEARNCGVKYWTWVNCVQWLKSTRQITTRKTTRGVIVFVVNYEQYQNLENYKNKTENKTSDKSATRQQQVGTNTINKNGKNEKMKELSIMSKALPIDVTLSNKLFEMLMTNNPAFAQQMSGNNTKRATKIHAWCVDIEKMRRIDNRKEEQIQSVIDWIGSNHGAFWQSNIMSGKKLREKYNTIVGQMKRTISPEIMDVT